jgi:formylglycine-generating enzyme required for sulfatase activity
VLRKTQDVESFSISRYPVTLGQFRACVAAGACAAPPETACYVSAGEPAARRANWKDANLADDVAATCVGIANARAYCEYVGGKLPTLEQWFLAARGAGVRRYAWGAEPPTCEQHSYGTTADGAACSELPPDGRVAQHRAGASAQGVEDVLLTPGELLAPSSASLFGACEVAKDPVEGQQAACVVHGLKPAAIDSVLRLKATKEVPDTSQTPYGFRCALATAGEAR